MSNSPFRREAQDAQRTQSLGEILLVRPVSFTFLTTAAACAALAVALLFALGSYTRRTAVAGVVVPDTGLVKVYAQQPGIVLHRTVVEGQHVTRGTVLYTVSSDLQSVAEGHTQAALIEQAHQVKSSLQQELDKTRTLQQEVCDTLQAKLVSQRAELARLDDQLAGQRERTSIAVDGVARYRRLFAQDYISTDQFQQRQADLLDQQSKALGLQRDRANLSQALKETENELAGLALKQQNQLSQIERSLIDVRRTLVESEARRETAVIAPETGVATAVIAEPGQTTDTAHPVASIVPDGARWQVHLFVPSAAVALCTSAIRCRFDIRPTRTRNSVSMVRE